MKAKFIAIVGVIILAGCITVYAEIIRNLTALTGAGADITNDRLIINDDSANTDKSITLAEARIALGLGTAASPQFTGIELSHASANTLTGSSGVLSVEGVEVALRTGGNTFTGTQVFPSGQALIAPALGTIASGVGTALTALNGENVQDDTIDDDSLDFGTGADQISAADIPIADTGSIFTATDTEATLLELAKVPTKIASANYTVGTTDPRELYGGVIYVDTAATITAPAVAAGASFTVITIGAIAVSVDVNAADKTYLDGTALADGDKITNLSTAGDIAVFTYYSADGWHASTNGWTDGN